MERKEDYVREILVAEGLIEDDDTANTDEDYDIGSD
jgi:hypothetical protein